MPITAFHHCPHCRAHTWHEADEEDATGPVYRLVCARCGKHWARVRVQGSFYKTLEEGG